MAHLMLKAVATRLRGRADGDPHNVFGTGLPALVDNVQSDHNASTNLAR